MSWSVRLLDSEDVLYQYITFPFSPSSLGTIWMVSSSWGSPDLLLLGKARAEVQAVSRDTGGEKLKEVW